ncbi:MAG TPA: FAD:protein FMN transferase [Candidatus Evtepia faecavium]|nr:FAD:protein FMN transferase [Candidatus Evtepia faecavium]
MKRIAVTALALLLLLSAAGCTALQTTPQTAAEQFDSVEKDNFMLDTWIRITLYDWTDSSTIDLAFDEIRRLESLLSVEQEGSDLDRLAKAAGKAWVDIAPETEEILRLSKEYCTLSQGHFDVTTGPLVELWNIHDGEGHYPTQEELDAVLPLIGSDDLLVEEGRAYLAREGMIANLGAIAKGYIADQVKALLVEQGVEHAVINLGRNILLIGGRPDGTDFLVGVQDPNAEEGALADMVAAQGKSVVTSGVDERYFVYEGKKYHHVLDPFTGFPADTGVASVTILSDNSAQGDALSTTCLLLGPEAGMELIESLEGVEALFITTDGEQIASSGYEAYRYQE